MSAGVACAGRCRVASIALALLIGAAFGAGLLVAGMTDPARVVSFLAVTGDWDPSLGLVMAGAIAVYAPLARWIGARRRTPWVDSAFHLPTRRDLDGPLVIGSALFGVGWGLGGLCPGPGIVAAAAGDATAAGFVVAMLVGMLAQHGWVRR
jgi:hypothetical protein